MNRDVVIATLTLYSIYLGMQINDPDKSMQLSFFIFDPLTKEFEKFLEMIFRTNTKEIIFELYDVIDSLKTSENRIINILELKKNVSASTFPVRLYSRDIFMN